MRFLETGITHHFRWDAYVAPSGAPVSQWFDFRHPMPWPVSRVILRDTIDEIKASASFLPNSAPDITHWWLTSNGKLTLSEAPVQDIVPRWMHEHESVAKPLLAEIACIALPDRFTAKRRASIRPPSRPQRFPLQVPTWRATQLLQSIKSQRVLDPTQILQTLDKIDQGPQVASVSMRVAHAAILSILMALPALSLFLVLFMPAVINVEESRQNAQRFTNLAAILKEPERFRVQSKQLPPTDLEDLIQPEQVARIERASDEEFARFGRAFADLGTLERSILEQIALARGHSDIAQKPEPELIKLTQGNPEATPTTSTPVDEPKNQIENAKPKTGPFNVSIKTELESPESMIGRFKKWENEQATQPNQPWFGPEQRDRLLPACLIPLGVLVLWGGIFRGGFAHFISSLAVVKRDGLRAGFFRSLLRSFLFWIPFFSVAFPVLLLDSHGIEWTWWSQQFRRFFLILPIIYLVIAIRYPKRGPHDIASGTYVVPR